MSVLCFLFKQKTAYEMRISDWSSDVCSSDLIAADYEVPCLLVADASARTVSLAENVQREAMHPADQFAAFAALVKEGRPIEDIAADFGVSPLVVQRRLKPNGRASCRERGCKTV